MVGLVLLFLAVAVACAAWLLPRAGTERDRGAGPGDSAEVPGTAPSLGPSADGKREPRHTESARHVPEGFRLHNDPAGFQVAVPEGWKRSAPGKGQVRYNGGQVELVVVNGRDSTGKYGADPGDYQTDREPELAAYRASHWATVSGLRRTDVGETSIAEGTFGWQDSGRQVYARNRAMVLGDRYHVLLVLGSTAQRQEVDRTFAAAAGTYQPR